MAENEKRPSLNPPPPVFDKPEPVNWLRITMLLVYIVIGLIFIAWMVITNPPQPRLICGGTRVNSFNSFGNCIEEPKP